MTALTDLLAGRIDPGVYTWRPSSTTQPGTTEPTRTTRAVGSATPSDETGVASAPAAAKDSRGAQKASKTQRSPAPHRNADATGHGGEATAWAAEATAWAAEATRAGWRPIELSGRGVADKEAFLRRCADAFGFPEWFGMNWDALEDSLTDLDWLPARTGYLVVYDSWDQLASTDPGSFRAALDVFAEAVESWRDSATPMAVLLPTAETITGLPDLN